LPYISAVSDNLPKAAIVFDYFHIVKMLDKFADTLDRHRSGILAYYDYPISTGLLEGTNYKIKTLQKQAYGYRDIELFKLKIYALHETKYALVG
jgi:transposase